MSQIRSGIVISNKMHKTVVVEIRSKVRHPFYKKLITRTTRFKAHNDLEVQVGQKVRIQEVKPISKEVHFKILEVIK